MLNNKHAYALFSFIFNGNKSVSCAHLAAELRLAEGGFVRFGVFLKEVCGEPSVPAPGPGSEAVSGRETHLPAQQPRPGEARQFPQRGRPSHTRAGKYREAEKETREQGRAPI